MLLYTKYNFGFRTIFRVKFCIYVGTFYWLGINLGWLVERLLTIPALGVWKRVW